MTLNEYIKSNPRSQRSLIRHMLAKQLGVSEIYVRSMSNGTKPIPAKYAIRIEKFTGGAVSRHTTAPLYYPLEFSFDEQECWL